MESFGNLMKRQFWSNDSSDVLVAYNFMLRVDLIYDIPLKSVHSFSKENEFEYIKEGGLNDYVHARRAPVTQPFSFQVERYCGINAVYDPLPNGAELTLPVMLFVSRNPDDFTKPKRTYIFTGCTVKGKEYGALEADQSNLLTETITIIYREMTCVDVPYI